MEFWVKVFNYLVGDVFGVFWFVWDENFFFYGFLKVVVVYVDDDVSLWVVFFYY